MLPLLKALRNDSLLASKEVAHGTFSAASCSAGIRETVRVLRLPETPQPNSLQWGASEFSDQVLL